MDCTAKARGIFETARNQPMRVCAAASGFSHCILAISNGISISPMPSSNGASCTALAANVEAMVGATLRCRQAITLPLLSRPASIRSAETVWRKSLRTSSSRVHCTFTGAPIAFESSAASIAKSHFDLRPKPPPSSVTLTVTFSGGNSEGLGDIFPGPAGALHRRPDLGLAVLDVGDRDRRLHTHMREVRQVVFADDHLVRGFQGGVDVAFLAHDQARACGRLPRVGPDRRRRRTCRWRRRPRRSSARRVP